jgi:hypothetical protein
LKLARLPFRHIHCAYPFKLASLWLKVVIKLLLDRFAKAKRSKMLNSLAN